jgi:hypothetical protein
MITMQDVLVRQCCAQGLQPPAVATSRCSRGHRRPRTVCFAAQDDAGSSTASRRSALMTLTAVAGAAASSTWVSYAVGTSPGDSQDGCSFPSSCSVNQPARPAMFAGSRHLYLPTRGPGFHTDRHISSGVCSAWAL